MKRNDRIIDHLDEAHGPSGHNPNSICYTDCMARVLGDTNNPSARRRVTLLVPQVYPLMMNRGELLAPVKLGDPGIPVNGHTKSLESGRRGRIIGYVNYRYPEHDLQIGTRALNRRDKSGRLMMGYAERGIRVLEGQNVPQEQLEEIRQQIVQGT